MKNQISKLRSKISLLILLLSVVFLCGGCGRNNNEMETKLWVSQHPKPITCMYVGSNIMGENFYTLIDANGNIFSTGRVAMNFPDVIDSTGAEKHY